MARSHTEYCALRLSERQSVNLHVEPSWSPANSRFSRKSNAKGEPFDALRSALACDFASLILLGTDEARPASEAKKMPQQGATHSCLNYEDWSSYPTA